MNTANSSSAPLSRARRLVRRAAWIVLIGAVSLLVAQAALRFVPLPGPLLAGNPPDTEFLDREGRSLRIVRPDDGPFRHAVEYGEIPETLIHATCAAEDRRFWSHSGVDWFATLRACGQLVLHRRVVSGGSTITQQLIKLAQPRPRTIKTKIIEALQALRLEQIWTKQQILAAYLNRLDYGNFNRGAASATQFYFAKPLGDLSPAECALLAALPQAPSRLNPLTHRDRALKRQQWVLAQMQRDGWLSADQFSRACQEPLHFATSQRIFECPHFLDFLLSSAEGSRALGQNNLQRIVTTIDLPLTHFSQQVLRNHLSQLRAEHVSNGAIVVLDNESGDVLSLVGSENYFAPSAGQVNGAWAPRSPGSALKPFTYWLAMEHGANPASIVADVPTEFATTTGIFAPVNYNHRCYGPMRYRLALANSLNISAVKVLASLGGPTPLQHRLQQCGLSTLTRPPENYGLGLTIGNADARLLELANAYASLARLGEYRPCRLLRDSPAISPQKIGEADAAYLISDILSDNDARALAFGADSALRFSFPVACKTGTSSDFRDNWAFGYMPEFTVGVWVGNFDGSPMQHVSGVTGAGPVLHEIVEQLHDRFGTSWYSTPTNIVERWVNPLTGKQIKQAEVKSHPDAVKEKFLASSLPEAESSADYSDSGSKVLLSAEYRDWFASSDNWLAGRAALAPATDTLRILFPLPGTTLYLDADLPQQGRQISLRASGPDNLEWHSASLQFATNGQNQVALLTEGRHELTVRDPAKGTQAHTWIEVLAR